MFPTRSRGIRPAQRGYVRTGGFYGRYNVTGTVPGLRPERKFFDTVVSGTVDTTAEALTSLNLIAQGVTQSTRVGRKCTVTEIIVKGMVEWTTVTNATMPQDQVRLILLLDKQANGANPSYADVFESASVSVNT
jgi:hypothetical protein